MPACAGSGSRAAAWIKVLPSSVPSTPGHPPPRDSAPSPLPVLWVEGAWERWEQEPQGGRAHVTCPTCFTSDNAGLDSPELLKS